MNVCACVCVCERECVCESHEKQTDRMTDIQIDTRATHGHIDVRKSGHIDRELLN